MTPPTLFEDPAARPQLLFSCGPTPGGGVELTALEARDGAERLMPTGPVAGRTARQLFAEDPALVDDWMAFLVRLFAYPGADLGQEQGEDGTLAYQLLQFASAAKDWVLTRLEVLPGAGQLRVTFQPPGQDRRRAGLSRMMDLQQTVWLEHFVEAGGHWEIDLATETIYLSRPMAKTLRFAADAVVVPLARFMNTVHPDDMAEVRQALENVRHQRGVIHSRTVLEDGGLLHFRSFGIPGYNAAGAMARIVGRSLDITDTVQAGHRLAESERRFRGIVENSKDMFVVVDTGGRIAYISPIVEALTGRSRQQVQGTPFLDYMFDPEEIAQIQARFADVMRCGSTSDVEFRITTAGGGVLWLSVRISAIPAQDGTLAEAVAVCRDITEERRQTERMRYLNEHDDLTGAYNRFYFERELQRMEEEGEACVGLMVTDLNGLKLVNNAFGHQRGDALLLEAANLLKELCGEGSLVARVGGDEFAVILHGAGPAQADALGEQITAACQRTEKRGVPLSISWGAACRASAQEPLQALYEQAESAMYAGKLLDSRSMRSQVLSSLKETLRVRNLETADHTRRMANMVMALGKGLGLPGPEFDRLVLLAEMHDIGKVAIPDQVINKPGRLTEDEWEIMRSHSEVGYRIAMTSQELSSIAAEIGAHHEWWNGRGYPAGLAGEGIPLLARIISVVDAYDVMTHKRVYKQAIGHNLAMEELRRCAGTQFDPAIVEMFLDVFGAMGQDQMRAFLHQAAEVAEVEPPPARQGSAAPRVH